MMRILPVKISAKQQDKLKLKKKGGKTCKP
jgi:hypothetical protein